MVRSTGDDSSGSTLRRKHVDLEYRCCNRGIYLSRTVLQSEVEDMIWSKETMVASLLLGLSEASAPCIKNRRSIEVPMGRESSLDVGI
jgi:hypothetical protein